VENERRSKMREGRRTRQTLSYFTYLFRDILQKQVEPMSLVDVLYVVKQEEKN
jgi:hypothetical protein